MKTQLPYPIEDFKPAEKPVFVRQSLLPPPPGSKRNQEEEGEAQLLRRIHKQSKVMEVNNKSNNKKGKHKYG